MTNEIIPMMTVGLKACRLRSGRIMIATAHTSKRRCIVPVRDDGPRDGTRENGRERIDTIEMERLKPE